MNSVVGDFGDEITEVTASFDDEEVAEEGEEEDEEGERSSASEEWTGNDDK